MKRFISLFCFAMLVSASAAQDKPTSRFGILINDELYKQKTPKDTLNSVIQALERERFDYLAAHLLEPSFVNSRMQTFTPYFEKVAAEQISKTGAGARLQSAELQMQVREKAETLNFKRLALDIRKKMLDDADNLKAMKKLLRDGQFVEEGDSARATLKDEKDVAIYFKKIENRWFMENRREDKPAKE